MNDRIYKTGAKYWQHLKETSTDLIAAHFVGGKYIDAHMRLEGTGEEKQFCRGLFAAMYEDVARLAVPARLIYPYTLEKAAKRLETSFYHESKERNAECARAIDAAINASCYKTNHYNLELAAMSVAGAYGFNRVNAVLAHNLQRHDYDGRYSRSNKAWAQGFSLADEAFRYSYMNAHPILLEDFTKHTRTLYDAVGAERFWIPGQPETGTSVHGYDITRSIYFDDKRGFAIGRNLGAPSPYVCWQFTVENGARDFYWGTYCTDGKDAVDNYLARVMVHMDGGAVREVYNPLAAAEMSAENNYNMIDGRLNNEKPRLDLTDGQTHEEVDALAPQTLPAEKPSVLAQIREARKAPPAPRKDNAGHGKDGPEL